MATMFGLTPSGTGVRVTLGGYLGLTIGWVEGIEINFLGAVFGLDLRRPALKLPGVGARGFRHLVRGRRLVGAGPLRSATKPSASWKP